MPPSDALGNFDLVQIARRVVIDRRPQQVPQILHAIGGSKRRTPAKVGDLLLSPGREVGTESLMNHLVVSSGGKVEFGVEA